jgi:CheY-like chemotaxis protein
MIPTLTPAEPLTPDTLPVVEADRPVALVVDDDSDTRRFIKRLLERDGWSVREAGNGVHALMLAREHVPEAILLDLALPTISGLDVLSTLKTWHDQPTRVVVVSAFAMLMRLPAMRLADAAIQKPFGAAELLAQVSRTARRQVAPPATPWRSA